MRCAAIVSLIALGVAATAGAAPVAGATSSTGRVDAKTGCSSSKPAIKVGTSAPIDVPGLTLKTATDAVKASVTAFNSRGGINGSCMTLTTCDNKNDPNGDRDCARQFAAAGVVATFNDFFNGDEAGADAILDQAHISRVGYNPGTAPAAVNSPYSFDFTAGGLGTTIAMPPSLYLATIKKFSMLRVDVPAAAALAGFMKPMLQSLHMTLTADTPVPSTATDFTQFVLSSAQSGANGVILPLGDQQAKQVLKAAQQVSSKLTYGTSNGTLSQKDMQSFGTFAKQIVVNAPVPPASVVGDPKYPGLKQAVKDLSASGNPDLQAATLKSNSTTGWLSVYAFVTIMKAAGTSTITTDSVFNAFNAAKNVDMGGLIPPWTPSAQNSNGIFPGISNGVYTLWTWGGKNFKATGKSVNIFDLLNGTVTSI
jgi:ABC-type branched-subunit amino acid transport system substrate-binding protein